MATTPTPPAKARPPATTGNAAARGPAVEAALRRSLFVIPSVNGGSLLRRMLPTLRLPPHTVVVLDQGSADDTEAVCRDAGVRLVQLGRPHTYTEAGNIGARMARDAGCDFVFISNNDIAFTTDVGAELLAEMLDDPRLGIVAPSQVVVDEKAGERFLACRAEWHLDTMLFTHDVRAPREDIGRMEADLCELTCAAVRMSAIDEIGFLDDEYGFYYEDADFCFRLRRAGYSCAYLPRAQIEHYTSSTFSAGMTGRKRAYMARNMDLFARKHLGYGVGRLVGAPAGEASAGGLGRHLPRYLRRFGLIEPGQPCLVHGAAGTRPLDYLYTDAAASRPGPAHGRLASYRGLVATSERDRRALLDSGLEVVGCAPPGIETDLFHPWVAEARPYDETTFLCYGWHHDAAALAATLRAWALFRTARRDARLIVAGSDVLGALRHAPACVRQWRGVTVADYPADGVSLRQFASPPSDEDLATLFRGVDAVVFDRPCPGSDLAAALACGTPALVSAEGAAHELACAGTLTLAGARFVDEAWAPDVDALAALYREACDLGPASRRALAHGALPLIRSRLTWRSTCAGLGDSLSAWQEQRDVGLRLRRRREAEEETLQNDPEKARFDARDTGEPPPEARPHPRPAPPAQPLTLPDVPEGPRSRPRRLIRGARRLKSAGFSTYGVWRVHGKRAAVRSVGRSLALRAGARLRRLVLRLGFTP